MASPVSTSSQLQNHGEHRGGAPVFWPLLLAFTLLLVLLGLGEWPVLKLTGGRLSFPIDDAYGHLAIAKNLVRHGIWTFNAPTGFSSGASSLIWPVLIAGIYAVFGVNEWASLALNIVAAGGLLWLLAAILRRHTGSGRFSLATLVVVVFLTPLTALVGTGMEHTFQALLSVAFVYAAARGLAGEQPPENRRSWLLPALGGALVMTRYEGLFLVGVVGLLLLARRRWAEAVVLGVAAALPVVLFGLYSISKGWYFLPNSLLLKGSAPAALTVAGMLEYFGKGWRQLLDNPHLVGLVVAEVLALIVALIRHRAFWRTPVLVLVIALGATAVHLQLASTGWFYRYEAYLIVLGLLGIAVELAALPRVTATTPGGPRPVGAVILSTGLAVVLTACAVPLVQRAASSLLLFPRACKNIYDQQYQMARFFREFYNGKGIAVNDIGAISFFSKVRLFDIYGLVDIDVLRAKRANAYDHAVVRRGLAAHDVRAIAVYDNWAGDYGGQLPEWVPVGRWTLPDNIICGGSAVSFYAPDASFVPELTSALQAFAPRLPADVLQDGPYRGGPPPPMLGVYPPEQDPGGTFYWVTQGAHFNFERPPGSPEEGTVTLSVKPITPEQRLEVFFNGEPVATQTFSPGQLDQWVPVTLRVRWREGFNTLSMAGHGKPVQPPGDGRKLLYALRDPVIGP